MEASLVFLFVLGLLSTAVGEEGPKFGCELTINNLRHAVQEVSDWYLLGLELGVPTTKLESLKRDPTLSYDVRKNEMLQMWQDNDLDASWEKLCEALDRLDKRRLAAMIREKCVVKSNTDTDTEYGDTPPTVIEEAVYVKPLSSALILAGSVGVTVIILFQVLRSNIGRGHIVLVVTGIAFIILLYGIWSNHDAVPRQNETPGGEHETPASETTSSLQKPLYCNNREVVTNLPELKGLFLGRSYNVQDITWLLVNTNHSYVRAVGIYGSPAVGKSTLAIHTAHVISQCGIEVRYIDLFDTHQLFEHRPESTKSVPVTSSPDLWTSTSPGPVLFETPNDGKKARSLSAQGLLEWAKGVKKDTLLVLDNCDNILGIEGEKLKELISNILQQSSSKCRLIVTSRHKIAIPALGFKKYYLRELDNDSAIQLLLKSNHGHLSNHIKLSKNDSKQIAALVDNNPLALHICADLVDETYPPNQLIAELKDTPMDVLSADILPDSRKMVSILYLSYKHLHDTTRSCGHYLSLFPGSFAEDAAIKVLSMSQFSNSKDCLEKLRDRSLIRPYEIAGQFRYQYHRLVKEFFNYRLKNGSDLEFDAVNKTFHTSFQWCYSRQLYYLAYTHAHAYTYKKSHDQIEEVIGRFELDSHNFIALLELVAIHRPLSIESVYGTAHSLVNSDLVLNIITEMELFRSLKSISLVLLYNSSEDLVVPRFADDMPSFWAKIFTRLYTIAISSPIFLECRTLCMETFEFPSNVSSVIYDIMATEYYVPRLAMHCDWLVCWFGVRCTANNFNTKRWVDFGAVIFMSLLLGVYAVYIAPESSPQTILFLVVFLFVVISCIISLIPGLVVVPYMMLLCGFLVIMYHVSRELKCIKVFILVAFLSYPIAVVMGIGTLMLTTLKPAIMVGVSLAVLVIYLTIISCSYCMNALVIRIVNKLLRSEN